MKVVGLISLAFIVVNLHACSQGDIVAPQLMVPIAAVFMLISFFGGDGKREETKDNKDGKK